MTNESAILGILADLYRDRAALDAQNRELREQVATLEAALQDRQDAG